MKQKIKKISILASLAICLALATSAVPAQPSAAANPATALTRGIVTDDYDDATLQALLVDSLWVDAANGNDNNDGLTAATALRTIQQAADMAGPGTTVHILPGIYRETVQPRSSGSAGEPIIYVAENGPGTAVIRGSEPASSLTWTQLTANTIGLPHNIDPINIYYTDLSTWELDSPPRFVIELDASDKVVTRLPLAREPDWSVTTEWKYHEFWWAADGGLDVAGCDPSTDPDPTTCDRPWRSDTQLTDRTDDTDPPGIEPGNLTTLGNLTGATLVAIDTSQGHYNYRLPIVAHDVAAGRVTVAPTKRSVASSLGWGSKYYVEDKPSLLDKPGEWWYDKVTQRLYLWPSTSADPAMTKIEISRWDNGFDLSNRSYITLDGLALEFFDETTVYQDNEYTNKSYDNIIRNAALRYANRGVWLDQVIHADAPADNFTDGFILENSEIAYMDTEAICLNSWWDDGADADAFTRPGIVNTIIRNNELHHLGFRSDRDTANGSLFKYIDRLRFEDNHVHHVAHNGIKFSKSVIQSSKEYNFSPEEIKTGEILIKNNIFEAACQLTTDCGALKFWGEPPDNHVFRDVLITGNVFRNTFGWTYVSEERGNWTSGTVQGMGGFGLYVDNASGIHAYRNIAYNNAQDGFHLYGVWRDGDIVYYNNIAANSLYGFNLGGSSYDTHGNVNTQVVNNIVLNNEGFGILVNDADGIYTDLVIDHNLYYGNGWGDGVWKPGAMSVRSEIESNKYYQTLAEIQANTPWEVNGVEGDPLLTSYDVTDYDRHDGSWPDFHLTGASANAIDKGTDDLPASLATLLDRFGVQDPHWQAYDIGRYEVSYAIKATPTAGATQPGVATYILSTVPADAGITFSLSLSPPPPGILVELSSEAIHPGGTATLTMTSQESDPKLPGEWETVTITATGGGFTRTAELDLLVGGYRFYMPLIVKGW